MKQEEDKRIDVNATVDRPYAVVGEHIMFRITVTQISEDNITGVVISELLPERLEFIKGTVCIDGANRIEENILAGIELGGLDDKVTRTIVFKARVLEGKSHFITTNADVEFTYSTSEGVLQRLEERSNDCKVTIYNPSLTLTKRVSPESPFLNSKMKCEIEIKNNGDLDLYNIHFIDVLANHYIMQLGTLKIDGRGIHGVEIEKGLRLRRINKGEKVQLTYEIVIKEEVDDVKSYAPEATFKYGLPDGSIGEKKCVGILEANHRLKEKPTIFKQFNIDHYLTLQDEKLPMASIDSMTVEGEVLHYYIAESAQAVSIEGQKLTGYNLMLRGGLNILCEYTTIEVEQSTQSSQFSIPFSCFLVCPATYRIGSLMDIEVIIEDIYYKIIDCRNFFIGVGIRIEAKSLLF